MTKAVFKDFDFPAFWEGGCIFTLRDFMEQPITDEMIARVEEEWGPIPEDFLKEIKATNLESPMNAQDVAIVEEKLGYKLPASYIEFMQHQNGGTLKKRYYPVENNEDWKDGIIEVNSLMGVGYRKPYTLAGTEGQALWTNGWGYPRVIGLYIADLAAGPRYMIALDYRECGKQCEKGEPKVVLVDERDDYSTLVLAETFEEFVNELFYKEMKVS